MRVSFVVNAFKRNTGFSLSVFCDPEELDIEITEEYRDVSGGHMDLAGYQPLGFQIQQVENGGFDSIS